jgi:hypothetical protein
MSELVGVGLYTPAEASRLLRMSASKIVRWLRGHRIGGRDYPALWSPQVDLGDGRIYLGFRDLMEARVADAFIEQGVPAQRIRRAIAFARDLLGVEKPLSADRFRTDGRDIFLRIIETDEHGQERERLLNLFRSQYEFRQVIEPLLMTVDFNRGAPVSWWPSGRRAQIVVDPARAFGQPIEATTSIPTAVLAAAANANGIAGAARAFEIPEAAVRRALAFESDTPALRAA